jgi:hypothetical protein
LSACEIGFMSVDLMSKPAFFWTELADGRDGTVRYGTVRDETGRMGWEVRVMF